MVWSCINFQNKRPPRLLFFVCAKVVQLFFSTTTQPDRVPGCVYDKDEGVSLSLALDVGNDVTLADVGALLGIDFYEQAAKGSR